MNPGIFYLYEYKNNQKNRTVGFLKLVRHYGSCTLQLQVRGIPVTNRDTVKLYAFYMEHDSPRAVRIAELPCGSRAVSAKLNISETSLPDQYSLNNIHGFLLQTPDGGILGAAMPGISFEPQKIQYTSDVQKTDPAASDPVTSNPVASAPDTPPLVSSVQEDIPAGEPVSADETPPSEPQQAAQQPPETAAPQQASERPMHIPRELTSPRRSPEQTAPRLPETAAPRQASERPMHIPRELTSPRRSPEQTAPQPPEPASERQAPARPTHTSPETAAERQAPEQPTRIPPEPQRTPQAQPPAQILQQQSPEPEQTAQQPHVPPRQEEHIRKIERSDMSVLPRKYWNLANNSFLLHGYNNYNHLLLVEKDGHYWLGVPGVYDTREARAAELFGFPQFTSSYNQKLSLSGDECNEHGDFGYWCRFLK